MEKKAILKKIQDFDGLKMTALRQDLLDIFLRNQKPISAYDVLDKLKQKRPNAQPPTVYRVIEYFVQKKIIHRVETGNKYVCCSQLQSGNAEHHGVLFLCQKCGAMNELADEMLLPFLKDFSVRHDVQLDEAPIELKGLCVNCK